ncbi:unnamed protein product [Lactuca saligna]|uniref:QLQ domain-containing protein n=1 Tax=Lactuca saligna TaxID=75948 RepID=A0AA35YS15_LACSI|nr:unnamed protein product [Lactuca saligna]
MTLPVRRRAFVQLSYCRDFCVPPFSVVATLKFAPPPTSASPLPPITSPFTLPSPPASAGKVQLGTDSFTFDHVYGSSGSPSSSMFEDCVSPLVKGLQKQGRQCHLVIWVQPHMQVKVKVKVKSPANMSLGPDHLLQLQHVTQQMNRSSPQPPAASSNGVGLENPLTTQKQQTPQGQPHPGFTKQQLHVLKAQILAFRRIKKGKMFIYSFSDGSFSTTLYSDIIISALGYLMLGTFIYVLIVDGSTFNANVLSRYEKLQRWDDALKAYTAKICSSNKSTSYLGCYTRSQELSEQGFNISLKEV